MNNPKEVLYPMGVSVLGTNTPIEKSPVLTNQTKHHDRLSGVVDRVTKESTNV